MPFVINVIVIEPEDLPRLSLLDHDNINIVVKYSFNLPETIANGELRLLIHIEDEKWAE